MLYHCFTDDYSMFINAPNQEFLFMAIDEYIDPYAVKIQTMKSHYLSICLKKQSYFVRYDGKATKCQEWLNPELGGMMHWGIDSERPVYRFNDNQKLERVR